MEATMAVETVAAGAEDDDEVTCYECGAPLGEAHSHGCKDCECIRCRRDDLAWDGDL